MFQIAEKVDQQVAVIKSKQVSALDLLQQFVNNLSDSHLDPRNASCEVVQKIQQLSADVSDFNDALLPYATLGFDIDSHLDRVDTTLENVSDQFFEWTQRRMLSVREVCLIFGKSRWTIYRWIKDGKLNAYKDNRNHWVVIV